MRIERDQIQAVLILMGLGVAFLLLGYLPTRSKAAELDQRISQASQVLAAMSDDDETCRQLASDIEQLEQAVAGAQGFVPQDSELASVLRQITNELNAEQCSNPQIMAKESVEEAHYGRIPMTLDFAGSFETVFGFLKRLESMDRLVRIDKLEIRTDDSHDDTTAAHPLRVKMEVSTFYAQVEVPAP